MTNEERNLPWAGRLTALKKVRSTAEAIQVAKLGWEVALKEPVYVDLDSQQREVERHQAVVRLDNGLPLGVVGMKYQPIQNCVMLEFIDKFLEVAEIGVELVAAGEIDQGRRVVVLLKLDEDLALRSKPKDHIDVYVVMINTHDGSAAFRVGIVPIRLFCTNQLRLLLRGQFPWVWSFPHLRHTSEHAKSSFLKAEHYLNCFAEVSDELAGAPISSDEFKAFLESLITIEDDATDLMRKNRLERRSQILQVYEQPANQALHGTKWGALNAVAEWEQWVKPMRIGEDRSREDCLLDKLVRDLRNKETDEALSLLTA